MNSLGLIIALSIALVAKCVMAHLERRRHDAATAWLRKRWYEAEQQQHRLREQNIFLRNSLRKLSSLRNQTRNN